MFRSLPLEVSHRDPVFRLAREASRKVELTIGKIIPDAPSLGEIEAPRTECKLCVPRSPLRHCRM